MVVVVVSPADPLNARTNNHDEDAAAAAAVAATADGCVTAAAADADANVMKADGVAGAGAADSHRRRGLRVGVHATPLRTPPPDAIATAVLGRGNDESKHSSFSTRFTTFMTCNTSFCTRAQLDVASCFFAAGSAVQNKT